MTTTIVIEQLPGTLEAFEQIPQAQLETPTDTAGMLIVALASYPDHPEEALKMIDFVRGPRPMTGIERQFIADRFREKTYLIRSYFEGATPDNDYTPTIPYRVVIEDTVSLNQQDGMIKLMVASKGADSLRPITVRNAKDGKWYAWNIHPFCLGFANQKEVIRGSNATEERRLANMRCVIVNMKDYVFSDAVAQSLQADQAGNFSTEKVRDPQEVLIHCKIKSPYAVLLEVTGRSPFTLSERMQLIRELKQNQPTCKVVIAVDENSEPNLAMQVREEKKRGGIDAFIYCSISATYLVALIDSL